MTQGHDIIVVGASVGGVQALTSLVAQLPAGLPAALFVVLHLAPDTPSMLDRILDRAGPLKAIQAVDGSTIRHGHIYVAPPDHHLLVKQDHVRVVRGPKENRWRPAIDPLLRSAAVAYGSRVVGVVLTGYLNDGTVGMLAVKRCGGVAVVQAPDDAAYSDMPESVLKRMEVDYCVPLAEIGAVLHELARQPVKASPATPPELVLENEMSERITDRIGGTEKLGAVSAFVCPECQGPLWEIADDNIRRYRCYLGHAYTAHAFLADQNEAIERALWAAMQALQERANLLTQIAHDDRQAGHQQSAMTMERRAAEAQEHAQIIRQLLQSERPLPDPQRSTLS